MEIRPARADDVERLAELWALAFPGERSAPERADDLLAGGTYGGLETAWVGTAGGDLQGAFRIYDLTLHLFGRAVPTAGLAAVAVAPASRRRGVGRELCLRAMEIGRERGALLSALYPFRVDFYARMGYGLAGELHRYRFRPSQLPAFPGVGRVRPVPESDREEVMPELYRSLAPSTHGLLSRPRAVWKALLGGGGRLVFAVETGSGERDGYLLGRARRGRGGSLELHVRELLAGTGDGYRALLGWISAQRDTWGAVVYDALPGERFDRILAHPRLPASGLTRGLWFRSATVLRGPMVRILDPGRLLELLEADTGTELSLADAELPAASGIWRREASGEVRRTAAEAGSDALPVSLASSALVEGRLPGLLPPRSGFRPALGIPDFRMLDTF